MTRPNKDNGPKILWGWLWTAAAIAFILWLLSSCASVPCESCIGPYDLTLSSHREALLRP